MKEIDFRVGDKVCHIECGNGAVEQVDRTSTYPIVVLFTDSGEYHGFTVAGREYCRSKRRSLFHGHDLEFTVDEKLPVRTITKWVYLYFSDSDPEVKVSLTYSSKKNCEYAISTSNKKIALGPIKIEIPEEI